MTKTRAGRYRDHQGTPSEFVGSKLRSPVRVLDVPCPDCKAEPGDPCLTTGGTPSKTTHPTRRRMATRAANEARDWLSAEFMKSLSPMRRYEIRRARGISQEQAGAFFGLTGQTFQAMEAGDRAVPDLHACAYGAWLRLWDPLTPTEESNE